MLIKDVIVWYEKNVNYKLTQPFIEFLITLGIIKKDVDIDILNLFLLERYNDEYVKINNKFKVKENRIPIIDKYKPVKKAEKPAAKPAKPAAKPAEKKAKPTQAQKKPEKKATSAPRRFRIEKIGGRKLKLVKI